MRVQDKVIQTAPTPTTVELEEISYIYFCDKTINVQAQLMLHIVRWCKFER